MSPLPGHTVTIGERPASAFPAVGPSTGFMIGISERGSTTAAVPVYSLTDAVAKLGSRVSGYPILYDSLDTAFREGASTIYVGRAIGEGAAASSNDIVDAAAKKVIKANAKSAGTWGNNLKVEVTSSGGKLTIAVKLSGTTVESRSELATNAEAIEWFNTNSSYITLAANEAGELAKTQTVELKTGKDENDKVGTTQLEAALKLFIKDLGPGQLAAPGFSAEAVHKALFNHASANNRRVLADDADGTEASALVTDAAKIRSFESKVARYGALFAPWAIIPGLSAGTYRKVPYSAVQMGLIARAEAEGFNPNQAAAGKRGRCRFATNLAQSFTDAHLEELSAAGVTAAKLIRGVPTTYDNRTLTNQTTDGDWKSFSASRLVMAIAGGASEVLENYDFEQIDGHGYVFKDLEAELSGTVCIPFYLADALYGQTPAEAFAVNTGPDVNTPTTISNEEIKAQISIRVSRTGEYLNVEVVKVPTTESL